MKRFLLLGLFVVLMADNMFGWGLAIAPGLSIKNAALYVIVLLLAMEVAVTRDQRIFELPSIHLLFGLLIAIAAFSLAVSSIIGSYTDYQPISGLFSLKGRLIDHYLFFMVFFLAARTWLDVMWLQRWILVVIAVASIVTVMDAYNFPNLDILEVRRDGRVTGPLGEANQYGLFVALFLPILIARAWAKPGVERVFFSIGALFTFWVLVLTVSRGAYVALLFGSFAAAIYLKPFLHARYVLFVAVVGLIAAVAAALVLGQDYATLITERTLDAASSGDSYAMSSGRTWIWATALERMMAQPASLITGYGWHTFDGTIGIAPHNTYFWYFFELGVFGALIYIALLLAVLRHSKRAIASENATWAIKAGLIGFTFGFCALMVGLTFVELHGPWYFIWAYCGLSMRAAIIAARPGAVEEGVAPSIESPQPEHSPASALGWQKERGYP